MGIDLYLTRSFDNLDWVRIQDLNDGTKLLPQLLVLLHHIFADELDHSPSGLFEVICNKLPLDERASHWDS